MSNILIRGLGEKSFERLRKRAKRHGRSLQSEARVILEHAAGAGPEDVAEILSRWKTRLGARRFASSVKLLREDRRR